MEIAQEEYEERRHIFDFYRWINLKLSALEAHPNFEEIYFERKGSIKKLLEEAIPVAHLGLYFCKPWRNVFVQCLIGNQPFDAVIEIQDPKSRHQIKVEVTTTETERTTMQRQALARNGSVFFTGPIRKKGRQVISDAEMVDLDVESQEVIDLAFERYVDKIEHEYDDLTALLTFVSFYRPLRSKYRMKLLERIGDYNRKNKPHIYGAYFYYSTDFGIDGLKKGWPEFSEGAMHSSKLWP